MYSVYLIVLHTFSAFIMNALSLASQRAKKVCFEYGKDVHFFIVQKWNVTGYVFRPYIGRTFFAPWGGGTFLEPPPSPHPHLTVAD